MTATLKLQCSALLLLVAVGSALAARDAEANPSSYKEYDERKGYGYQEPRDKDYNYLKATNPYPSPSIVCPECALTCPNITCEPADCNCEAQSCNCEPQSCTCGACSPAACTCSPTCDCPDIDFSKFPACPACPECKPTQTQECITNIDTCCNGGDCPVKCPPTQLFCDPECVTPDTNEHCGGCAGCDEGEECRPKDTSGNSTRATEDSSSSSGPDLNFECVGCSTDPDPGSCNTNDDCCAGYTCAVIPSGDRSSEESGDKGCVQCKSPGATCTSADICCSGDSCQIESGVTGVCPCVKNDEECPNASINNPCCTPGYKCQPERGNGRVKTCQPFPPPKK